MVTGADQDNTWRILNDQMKNEVTKVLQQAQEPNADQIFLVSKLMNMKDHLLAQVASGMLYKKLIVW